MLVLEPLDRAAAGYLSTFCGTPNVQTFSDAEGYGQTFFIDISPERAWAAAFSTFEALGMTVSHVDETNKFLVGNQTAGSLNSEQTDPAAIHIGVQEVWSDNRKSMLTRTSVRIITVSCDRGLAISNEFSRAAGCKVARPGTFDLK